MLCQINKKIIANVKSINKLPKKYIYIFGLIVAFLFLSYFCLKAPFKIYLSYYLKHAPLCLAENLGFISPLRAQFKEDDVITVNILRCTPLAKPQLKGTPMGNDIIVVSDLGGVVQRFSRFGEMLWQTKLNSPKGLFLKDNYIYVGVGRELKKISIHSGVVLNSYEFSHPINNIFIDYNGLYVLFDIEGMGAINEFKFDGGNYILQKKSNFLSKYPRGLYVEKNYIYVTDTYLNRIIKIDKNTFQIVEEASARFPMGILEFEGALIVAEDLNVITGFSKDLLIRSGYSVGCRRKTNVTTLKRANDMVFCDHVNANQELYSPNDVDKSFDYTYVADTHNHRIAIFYDGTFISQLLGFNNPVNIKAIKN
jgi:hypothetical protein